MSSRNLSWFIGASSDELIDHLKQHGWSIGEVGTSVGWKAYAEKGGLRIEGTDFEQHSAWQDLLQKMMLSGKFSRN